MLNFENGHTYFEGVRPLGTSENGKFTVGPGDTEDLEMAYAILRHQCLDLEALADELPDTFDRSSWLLLYPKRLQRFELLDCDWLRMRRLLQYNTLGELVVACSDSSPVSRPDKSTNAHHVSRDDLQELLELAVSLCRSILANEANRSD